MTDLQFYILLALLIFVAFMFNAGCSPIGMFSKTTSYLTFAKVSKTELNKWADDMGRDGTLLSLMIHLQKYMKEITYKPDGKIDYPRDPRVTLFRKIGDCDDSANLCLYACHHNWYNRAVMIAVFNDNSGHAYCYCDGYTIGNWGLYKFKSIEEANNFYMKNWNKYKIYDKNIKLVREVNK